MATTGSCLSTASVAAESVDSFKRAVTPNRRVGRTRGDAIGGEFDFAHELTAQLDRARAQLRGGGLETGPLDRLGLLRNVRAGDEHRDHQHGNESPPPVSHETRSKVCETMPNREDLGRKGIPNPHRCHRLWASRRATNSCAVNDYFRGSRYLTRGAAWP